MTKQPGAIRQVFQDVMRGAGRMGWMIGHMDSAAHSIELVLNDARGNLARNPRHKETNDAVNNLTIALKMVLLTADKLEVIASGEDVPK